METVISVTYQELLQEVAPRPLSSDRAYRRALRQIERLMHKQKKSRAEDDMITLLATLIEEYEIRTGFSTPELSPKNRLSGLIEARGITQADLARQSGVPRPTINEILSGKRDISKRNALRLAKYFRVPVDEFLTDDARVTS